VFVGDVNGSDNNKTTDLLAGSARYNLFTVILSKPVSVCQCMFA